MKKFIQGIGCWVLCLGAVPLIAVGTQASQQPLVVMALDDQEGVSENSKDVRMDISIDEDTSDETSSTTSSAFERSIEDQEVWPQGAQPTPSLMYIRMIPFSVSTAGAVLLGERVKEFLTTGAFLGSPYVNALSLFLPFFGEICRGFTDATSIHTDTGDASNLSCPSLTFALYHGFMRWENWVGYAQRGLMVATPYLETCIEANPATAPYASSFKSMLRFGNVTLTALEWLSIRRVEEKFKRSS